MNMEQGNDNLEEILKNDENMALSNSEAVLLMHRAHQTR